MTIICPTCKREVKLIYFGNGLIGLCCDKILYNKSENAPLHAKQTKKEDVKYTSAPEQLYFNRKNSWRTMGIHMNKSLYSTSEVARVFQISRVTVFRWVQEGNIKAYKVGKHIKIPSSEIERLRSKFGLPEDLLFRCL